MDILALTSLLASTTLRGSRGKTKMKNSCNKGLLIPWLLKALNEQLYEGLKWSDKKKNIFYIIWTHKSAEHWSTDVLEPFKAWAAHKGKLAGKNEKQLKATFRCALNSKKDELREVHRNRTQRFWQFLDSKSAEGKSGTKKRRRMHSNPVDATSMGESNDSVCNSFMDCSPSTPNSCCEAEIFGSYPLPSFGFSCYSPLTSQLEGNETAFSFADFFQPAEEKNSKKKKRRANRKPVDPNTRSASPIHIGNNLTNYMPAMASSETELGRTEKLPPFNSIYQPLTPPYQDNEKQLNTPEHSSDFSTSLSETSRLTPPVEMPPPNLLRKSNSSINKLSSDVWNPNYWSTPQFQQEVNMSPFFPNDFDDFGKSTNQDLNSNKMIALEMDQFVPVMNLYDNYSNRPFYEVNHCEQVNLEDDCIFSSEINSETEKVLEELQRLHQNHSSTDIGQYNYSS